MQNKIKNMLMAFLVGVMPMYCVVAEELEMEEVIEYIGDDIAADAIEEYEVQGSLFQQITDLEQEKVLMQLEKERAQLNLDLDRLAAEKIKLHMEMDTLSGRAEQQQQEFETERARLANEAMRIEKERAALDAEPVVQEEKPSRRSSKAVAAPVVQEERDVDIEKNYKLINVFGAGSQLQATLQDLSTGQNKKLTVGKTLDGYTVKSISLDEGVVFEKDGVTQSLNVGNRD